MAQAQSKEQPVAGAPPVQRKSDGQDGPPVLVAPPVRKSAGGPNAALKEPPPKAEDGVSPNHPCKGRLVVVDADQGLVHETAPDGKPRKKIAICGFASSTRHAILNRANDPEWSIWGLNQLYRHIPRADRWFDIHYNWDQEVVPGTDHRQWARDCGIPFYTVARQYDVPTNVRYPMERILHTFEADYFTSTIPYMLALALWEIDQAVKVELAATIKKMSKREVEMADLLGLSKLIYSSYTIGIYGIDLVVGSEYFSEKPCAEFWIGAAALGRGIRVEIPAESALCKQLFRYGSEPEPDQIIKTLDISRHLSAITAERDEQLKRLYMLEGAIQCDQRWMELHDLRTRGAKVD